MAESEKSSRGAAAVIVSGLLGVGVLMSVLQRPPSPVPLAAPPAEEAPTWVYDTALDSMTSKPIRSAILQSTNQFVLGFPYQGLQRATLRLRVHPRWGYDVLLSVERGQFNCRLDGCPITLRYGDGQAWEYRANEPADGDTTTLFVRGYDDIFASLKRSDSLRIEAQFYREGVRVFEFNTRGLKWN